jgi:methionyl aminopeptidase
MARGGAILAATHAHVKQFVRPSPRLETSTSIVEEFIRSHAGAEPAFKGLYGFPASACISVNEEIVHGIPVAQARAHEGDIVSSTSA